MRIFAVLLSSQRKLKPLINCAAVWCAGDPIYSKADSPPGSPHPLCFSYRQRAQVQATPSNAPQRQMLTFGRHPRDSTHIGNTCNTAYFGHQSAETLKLQFSKIEVDSPNGVNLNTAVNQCLLARVDRVFAGQTESVFTKDFQTHGNLHLKKEQLI